MMEANEETVPFHRDDHAKKVKPPSGAFENGPFWHARPKRIWTGHEDFLKLEILFIYQPKYALVLWTINISAKEEYAYAR